MLPCCGCAASGCWVFGGTSRLGCSLKFKDPALQSTSGWILEPTEWLFWILSWAGRLGSSLGFKDPPSQCTSGWILEPTEWLFWILGEASVLWLAPSSSDARAWTWPALRPGNSMDELWHARGGGRAQRECAAAKPGTQSGQKLPCSHVALCSICTWITELP